MKKLVLGLVLRWVGVVVREGMFGLWVGGVGVLFECRMVSLRGGSGEEWGN